MMLRHNTLLNKRLRLDQRIQFFLSNFFYLSGLTVAIYLLSPLLAILLNAKPISDGYFLEWLPKYSLFFITNSVFVMSFAPRHRLQSLVLGMFSYMPYLAALCAEALRMPHFTWKPTNARAKGLITTLLAPYILYVTIAAATAAMLLTGSLPLNPSLSPYYLWLAVDAIVAVTFIVQSYLARAQVVVPEFQPAANQPNAIQSPRYDNVVVPAESPALALSESPPAPAAVAVAESQNAAARAGRIGRTPVFE
jgi:hypothetical protein